MPAHRSSKSSPLSRRPLHITIVHPPKPLPGFIPNPALNAQTAKAIPSRRVSAPGTLGGPYADRRGQLKGTARTLFTHMLRAETGDPHAVMHWTVKFFHERVFRRYECALRGWPGWIVFQNLSRASVGELYELIRLCQSGELHFSAITRDEYWAAEHDYTAAAPGPLFPASPPNYGYCNIGRRFVPTHRIQDGPKSAKEVDEVETAVPTVTEGFPIIMKDSACLVWSSSGYRDFIHGCEDPEDPIDDW